MFLLAMFFSNRESSTPQNEYCLVADQAFWNYVGLGLLKTKTGKKILKR